ncbi:MAG: serine hydrolase [Anaerolineae bacterium]|nr:serine hydrolase [Anaerolineae bacterium]MDQ7033571.1 serine hydrolase [Anaerolineae bacterium]
MRRMHRSLWMALIWLLVAVYPTTAQIHDNLNTLSDCGFTDFAAEDGLRIGAVILNLETGAGCTENLDVTFNVASVPKVFIAGTYYDMLINGQISGTTRQIFTQQYLMGGRSDCLSDDQLGNTYSSGELIDLMINCSDNSATWMLMDSIGWGRVQAYVDSLGIDGIGTIIPYSEVDRLKLTFLDERWATVPRGMASRFYRREITSGLLDYFDSVPSRPVGLERTTINQRYFDEFSFNTMTPRALADYLLLLRDDLLENDMDALTASAVFNTMLYTQRLFSTQALAGTIYVGSKNGFDMGLLAEANVLFDSLTNRIPTGLVIVFAQYDNLNGTNDNLPNSDNDPLARIFAQLSPQIRDILYPSDVETPVQTSFTLSSVTFNQQFAIEPCWWSYRNADFAQEQVPILENCWQSLAPRITFPVGDNLAMGLVLRNLNAQDTRLIFVYTAPDGRRFSYQEDRRNLSSAAIYWFHPLDMAGQWRVDIYINLQHIYSNTIIAQQ